MAIEFRFTIKALPEVNLFQSQEFCGFFVYYFKGKLCALSSSTLEIDYSDYRGMAGMQPSHIRGYTPRVEMTQKYRLVMCLNLAQIVRATAKHRRSLCGG